MHIRYLFEQETMLYRTTNKRAVSLRLHYLNTWILAAICANFIFR